MYRRAQLTTTLLCAGMALSLTGCQYYITADVQGEGTVTADPGWGPHEPGTVVTLTATPDTGWLFDHWEGDLSGTAAVASLMVDGDKDVTAVFNSTNPVGGACDSPTELTNYDISTDTTLAAGCYLAKEDIIVSNNATLTLAPGVTLVFAQGRALLIEEDGTLRAAGSAANPILLTGQSKTRGYWYAVNIQDSARANVLEYVTIEYAGSPGPDNHGALMLWDGAMATVRHTTLRECAKHGFYMRDAGPLTWQSNTITKNTLGPGYMKDTDVSVLDAASTYAGNDDDLMMIDIGGTTQAQRWAHLDVDYYVVRTLEVRDHALTLDPGVQLIFANGTSLVVLAQGALIAVGTAAEPISLTGKVAVAGAWGGISVAGYSVGNQLEHVLLDYAGTGSVSSHAAFQIYDHASCIMRNCTLSNGLGCGIWTRGASWNTDFQTVNTFSNFAGGNVCIQP